MLQYLTACLELPLRVLTFTLLTYSLWCSHSTAVWLGLHLILTVFLLKTPESFSLPQSWLHNHYLLHYFLISTSSALLPMWPLWGINWDCWIVILWTNTLLKNILSLSLLISIALSTHFLARKIPTPDPFHFLFK